MPSPAEYAAKRLAQIAESPKPASSGRVRSSMNAHRSFAFPRSMGAGPWHELGGSPSIHAIHNIRHLSIPNWPAAQSACGRLRIRLPCVGNRQGRGPPEPASGRLAESAGVGPPRSGGRPRFPRQNNSRRRKGCGRAEKAHAHEPLQRPAGLACAGSRNA